MTSRTLNQGNGTYAGGLSSKRSGIEILVSMMSSTIGGIQRTRIMQRANISYDQLQYYLPFLVRHGLVTVVKSPENMQLYEITELGIEFMMGYKRLLGYLNPDQAVTDE